MGRKQLLFGSDIIEIDTQGMFEDLIIIDKHNNRYKIKPAEFLKLMFGVHFDVEMKKKWAHLKIKEVR